MVVPVNWTIRGESVTSLIQKADRNAIPQRAQCQHIPATSKGRNPRTAIALLSRREPRVAKRDLRIVGAYVHANRNACPFGCRLRCT